VPYTTGDILLFLNNDVRVEPNWLVPLANLFDANPATAAAQPKIRSYKNTRAFEYAGAAGGFIDHYGYPFCRGRIFDAVETDTGQYDDETPIFWASGAALAVRKKVFEQINGFDEDFEFHMEEIDLCWRLWNKNHAVTFCPASIVYHLGGGSLPVHSPRKRYFNYRNNLIMLWKNYTLSSLLVRFPMRLMLDAVAALQELLKGKWPACKAIIKAHEHFWLSLSRTNRKRRLLQQKRLTHSNPPTMKKVSIVWQYFVKKISYFSNLRS
jgi:GT2 family glycosyltransferase